MFGRYATYSGSAPFAAPATLMLIAHVEQQGVWLVDGGMRRIAQALAALASTRGATFRYGAHVDQLLVEGGRVVGVVLDSGEVVPADAVIVNGDVAAVASGLFGPKVARVVPRRPVGKRSFSAITFSMLAESDGFPLIRHNFFFSRDYRAEFADIVAGRQPAEPTVYLCAQDRNDNGLTDAGRTDQDRRALGGKTARHERLFHQLNAVARGDEQTLIPAEIEAYAKCTFSLLGSCGLMVKWHPDEMIVSTPTDFHRRFPATGGALYGQATHGWRAPFQRPSVRTSLPGLYLAGGSTHPGAGVPMATLSGRMAAACLVADIASA